MRRDDEAKLTRRGALGVVGTLGAAALAGGCRRSWQSPERDPTARALVKPPVPGVEAFATHEERFVTSACGQCPAGCGIRVRVVEGRAVRIEGDRRNPLNRGGIGPRGLAGLQALYDPDRVPGPLIRRDGHLVRAGWDEALALVVDRLGTLRRRGAPEKLLVWTGGERGVGHELIARFARVYGTPNFIDGRPGRSAVLAQAMEACLGVHETPAYDWSGASYVLSLEAALVEGSCQAVHVSRAAAEHRRGTPGRRLRIVHAGPALDLAALDADEWLRIRPGTSGALALGLSHLLVRDGRAVAPEDHARFLDAFPPERVAQLTGLRIDDVHRLARELVEQGPAFVVVDERSLGFSNGFETAVAALGLNALLGAIERPEASLRLPAAPPLLAWPDPHLDEIARVGLSQPRLDAAGGPRFPRARCVHESLPEALGGASAEIAIFHQANPLWARQQPRRWREALARVPFVVAMTPFLDETAAALATVVLPDPTYLERWEDVVPAPLVPESVLGLRRPVVAPLHDTRPAGDVVLAVAQALGEPLASALPWRSFREALEARLGPDVRDRLLAEGFVAEPVPPPRAFGFSFQAVFAEPAWRGDPAAHPHRLLVYRRLADAPGGGANLPWLHLLRDRPGIEPWSTPASLHPDTVAGLAEGDRLEIASEWGAIEVVAHLDRRLERGIVAVPTGGGHEDFGRFARGIGANPMQLLAPGPAPTTGAAVPCGTRVAVRRLGGRS